MILTREPAVAEDLANGRLDLAHQTFADDVSVGRQLRLQRRALALKVAVGDLAGVLDLGAVTTALTRFADHALDTAIRTAIKERTPDAKVRGFVAIALGKQGSGELNYSSDIDPILLYDPGTLPVRGTETPDVAAVRIARRVVELLQARDGDGYVLRVDLRLRPSPEITPIALPVSAAISYYEAQALPWERAAFIRARAAAGDIALGSAFLDTIRPFVWRRALDFGAIRELRGISRRIRDHYAQGQAFGAGYDLKRGRGGIREAEFFAQIHQLIHGGRDPALRAPATRTALARLADAGWIGRDEAGALSASYTLLRTIEHRVQMVDDRQMHRLPEGEALDRLAWLHGAENGAALLAEIAPHVASTGRIYDALDDDAAAGLPHDPRGLEANLVDAGFADPDAARRRIDAWRGGAYPALRSAAAQEALEQVLPTLIPALATAPEPQQALMRLDAMIERLPSAINIFRLLHARPPLARLLVTILSHAPTLADELGRRANLLDGLIDASALMPVADLETLKASMHGGDTDGDYQALLDHVRRTAGEMRFALGVQIVAGTSDPLDVASGYARVAEAAIDVLASATVAAFVATHGRVAGSELVIVALGRMGGAMLTHASDLDLVYLFTGDFNAESDGAKPLGASLYYNRLAQRITAALSVPTAAGPLYQIDTRLRPMGGNGPLVVSLDSFRRYQQDEAWTWEHMALTRARAVFGSPAARAAVTDVIAAVLLGDRVAHDIVSDAREMRAKMAAHKPPQGPLDAKLLPGGLVDLEFATHVVQLTRKSGFDPNLRTAIARLVDEQAMPASMLEAHDVLTRLLVTLRLVAPDAVLPGDATQAVIARALGVPDWGGVAAALEQVCADVMRFWGEITV